MEKQQFKCFYSYIGNKRNDLKFFKDYINFKKCDTICEPFCGSCAFSIYSNNGLKKFILNDTDSELIEFYEDVKDNKFNEYLEYIKDFAEEENIKEKWEELKKKENKNKFDVFLINKLSSFRRGLLKDNIFKKINNITNTEKYENIVNFYTKNEIKLKNKDYLKIFEEVKDKENVFVFLDPPYLDSYNSSYSSYAPDTKNKIIFDNTKMYIDILELLKNGKCKVLLIINKNAINEYIFKDFIKGEYNKIYQITKRITDHLIITNY